MGSGGLQKNWGSWISIWNSILMKEKMMLLEGSEGETKLEKEKVGDGKGDDGIERNNNDTDVKHTEKVEDASQKESESSVIKEDMSEAEALPVITDLL
ncbi:unnamed protein product [Lactuca saligna]|uniref:Uncharacterized protein n=1 Tax=Lactuca saligna TaxID=75948 RepID=A0AA36DWR2_LACSI|nr:unnamed protein product [Lactuca saligna]